MVSVLEPRRSARSGLSSTTVVRHLAPTFVGGRGAAPYHCKYLYRTITASCAVSHAGRMTKFAPVKSLDSSEFSSEFSDLKTL